MLLAIIALATALRLYHLDYQSLWVDEIASMNGADPDQSWSGVITYSVSDQPPAFFLLLHSWFKIFPFTGFYGRLLPLIIGIAGIFAMFFLGKEVKNEKLGLIAALITTFSFIHILFSQEARFYTLLFFSSSMSYLFFIRAVKSLRAMDFVLYVAFTVVLLYTHYFGLVVLATQGMLFLVILLLQPFDRRFFLLSLGSAVIISLLLIPWIPTFFSDVQTKSFWIQHEPLYFPIQYFYVYFKDIISCIVYGIALLVYGASVYQKFSGDRIIDKIDVILFGSAFISFMIPLAYSVIQTPMLQVRYTLIALPSLIVMISLGISLFQVRFQRILIPLTCCSAFLSLIVIEQYYSKIRKEDWRGMVKVVINEAKTNDTFVSPKAWYCNFYFKSLHSDIRAVLPEQWDVMPQKPESGWWLDGFDATTEPGDLEKDIFAGFIKVKSDSLYRARATHYKRDE